MWTVEIVSHDTIKPTSPTPPHPSTHKLSWLDRMATPNPFSIILFYSSPTLDAKKSLPILKNSLSETLSLFYPLAGRTNPDDPSLCDCNDEGVDLFEAIAVTASPLPHLLTRHVGHDDLLPLLPPTDSSSLLSLQITVFAECGSLAIASSFSHALADGHSAAYFIDAWASTARGDRGVATCPVFDAASRFGTLSDGVDVGAGSAVRLAAPKGQLVTKRFVFEESAIDALRKSSTRFVALAALLWRCFVRTRGGNSSVAIVPVNMRGKSSLPDNLFGNLWDVTSAAAMSDTCPLEEKLRRAVRRVDEERVRRLQGADGWSAVLEGLSGARREVGGCGEIDYYFFTSWSRFPLYEADFGWGKPLWVAPARLLLVKDAVAFLGRGAAGGMDAWVNLDEEEMAEFELDEELTSYTLNFPR